jgi:peptidoglycan/LPS O-acetylase OafA/YrhL
MPAIEVKRADVLPPATPSLARNLFLDLSRGILAWVIVLVHVVWLLGYTHSGTRVAIGQWSVEAFMILAGYVAVASYRPEPYLAYLAKRFWRIVPVLAVCGILCLIVGTTLVPAWFVTLLVQFYLVFPLIMWAINRYGKKIFAALIFLSVVFMLPVSYGLMQHIAPMGELLPMNLFWFVLGMCGFYLVDAQFLKELSTQSAKFPLLIGLGELSYSTYLVHWPILFGLSSHLPGSLPNPARMALLIFPGLPLVALASVALNQWVELPGIKLGKYLILK